MVKQLKTNADVMKHLESTANEEQLAVLKKLQANKKNLGLFNEIISHIREIKKCDKTLEKIKTIKKQINTK